MRARLALLLLFAEADCAASVVITRSQTTADVDFMKSSPLGCFSRGRLHNTRGEEALSRALPICRLAMLALGDGHFRGRPRNSSEICEAMAAEFLLHWMELLVPGCVRFVYKAFWGECRGTAADGDENAVEIPSESPYLIAGAGVGFGKGSKLPATLDPNQNWSDWDLFGGPIGAARCRTETPGNGFPGTSPQSSQLAWPVGPKLLELRWEHGGKQPYSLECWPKRWDGAPLACTEEMHGINGTACGVGAQRRFTARRFAPPRPELSGEPVLSVLAEHGVLQLLARAGKGRIDCFVRGNFVPREAERLQHGSVRVLKDLTGYQIIGLWKGFDNSEGFFQKNEDAIAFCKHMCYSDIRCQYWTYAPNFGCWLEDASQEYGPPYPLTLEAARRDTDFAKDCVAGEYIQHFCPATGLPSQGEDVADGATECAERGYRYEPPSMFLSHRTVEPNWEACRSRCKWTVYCNYFAFWPDGGCLITGTDSQRVMAESYEVISGPIHCNASYRTAAPSVEAWASQTTLPNIGHSEVASVTAAPETMAHMAEIEIPIFGLDVGQLAANDQHLLEGRYAEAIAKTLALPVSEIKEGPDQNDLDAQVHLSPGVGGGCILTAWTPNEPVSSSDPSVLRSKLKTPALITNLKLATTQAQLPVSALPGAQIQVGEPQVGTKEHPLQALVEPPSFWSQWWPLLIALTFVPGFFRAAPADRDRGCGVPGEVSF
ncbi:Sterol 26-hydroxylase [Durusdinium trenchii]|uniref:Mitochondrial n=1 Tax=Durusdinium trenchii TaxID=1381693 RepID=A0ABP0NWZ1_9DINO